MKIFGYILLILGLVVAPALAWFPTAPPSSVASGVTNGDAHDHSGGDGAQIDHTGLANIGTNTHAQIDTHISNTGTIYTLNQGTMTDTYICTYDLASDALVCNTDPAGFGGGTMNDVVDDTSPQLGGDLDPNGHAITGYLPSIDEDNMASDSVAYVPTQQSVKAYVDGLIAGLGGDVTSMGDCASGACFDGSSDGGTYQRFYDGTANYMTVTLSGALGSNKNFVMDNLGNSTVINITAGDSYPNFSNNASDDTINELFAALNTTIGGLGGGHAAVTLAAGVNTLTLSTQEIGVDSKIEALADNSGTPDFSGVDPTFGDITCDKVTITKTSGVAGMQAVYEANSTDTDYRGFMGPSSVSSSWAAQWSSSDPASSFMLFAAPAGTGDPNNNAVSAISWVTPAANFTTFMATPSSANFFSTITDEGAFAATLFGYASAAATASGIGVGTEDSPQFTGIELGHATDTTITRLAAGQPGAEGKHILLGPTVANKTGNYTIGTDDSNECYGGKIYVAGAATITGCPAAPDVEFTVVTYGAYAVSVDPDATGTEDTYILDGTALAQGAAITNTSTTGDTLYCAYQTTDTMFCWSGSPDGDHWTGP